MHRALSAMLAAVGLAAAAPPVAEKALIESFFEFTGGGTERAERFQSVDYIQHNPRFLRMDEFTGARGRAAWIAARERAAAQGIRLVELGGIRLRDPVILMAEGDLVHAVYRGRIADPRRPGETYEAFAFEAVRIKDGKFTEHWDQVRLAPGWMVPGAAARNPTTPQPPAARVAPEPRPGCRSTPAELAANKRLALAFLSTDQPAPALLALDYQEHDPRGRGAPRLPGGVDFVLAECDFVTVVRKEVVPDPDAPSRTYDAFGFDTFRIRDGRVAERWNDGLR